MAGTTAANGSRGGGGRGGNNNKPSPAKGKGGSPAKPSPSRGKAMGGRRNKQEVKEAKPRSPGWYICGGLMDGNLAYFTVTQSDPGQDAYTQPLVEAVQDTNGSDPVCELGILGGYYMKVSLTDERPLTNIKDEYMRKAFVILMDEDEMTSEALLEKLQVVKTFLERPGSNRYKTKVFIPENWDLTPPGAVSPPQARPLPPVQGGHQCPPTHLQRRGHDVVPGQRAVCGLLLHGGPCSLRGSPRPWLPGGQGVARHGACHQQPGGLRRRRRKKWG